MAEICRIFSQQYKYPLDVCSDFTLTFVVGNAMIIIWIDHLAVLFVATGSVLTLTKRGF